MKTVYTALLLTIFLISCNSVRRTQKLVSSGNYDQAISLAVKKLKKDKTAKEYDPHIRILEEAFLKAKEANNRQLSRLKRENNPANAKEIYYTYLDLESRQELIRPLLPLYSKEMGRKANFVFSDYSTDIAEAKGAYVKYLYQEAKYYLQRNIKMDFRSAYNVLCELDEVQPNYKDVNQLKDEAHFQGTDFVLVSINNHSNQIIPRRLEEDLLDFNTYNLNDFWTEYHSRRENGIRYGFGIDLNFQTIQLSPERISEKQYTRKETIKDGYEYKRDRRGNIVKDSLGNPIRIDRIKEVMATVIATVQEKEVFVGGTVIFRDLERQRKLDQFPLSTEFIFKNIFATFRGDERTLTLEDKNIASNRFVPFPNNEQMVIDAGTNIKERFRTILMDHPLF